MSTRASIYYEKNEKDSTEVHIYEELADNAIYLEISIGDLASMRIICPPTLLERVQ